MQREHYQPGQSRPNLEAEATEELTGRARINAYTNQNNLYQHQYRFDGFRALVIEPKTMPPVTSQELLDYVDEFPEIQKRGIENLCFQIAKFSSDQNGYQGKLLSTSEGADFIGNFSNHFLVRYTLGDGSLIACDLTAALGSGQSEVLVIRAATHDELIEMLGDLYGGEWQLY